MTLVLCFTNSDKVVAGKDISEAVMGRNSIPCEKDNNCKPGKRANSVYVRGCNTADRCRDGDRPKDSNSY